MTVAYATLDAMRVALRARVGQALDTSILENDTLDEILNAALRDFNQLRPLWVLDSFSTVLNQQRYTEAEVGVPAGAFKPIRKIWWNGCNTSFAGTSFAGVFPTAFSWVANDLIDGDISRLVVDQTGLDILARNSKVMQRYFGGRGWQERDDYIWLEPKPTKSGTTVYFMARTARFATPDLVDTQFAEPVMNLAEAGAFRVLAALQSELAQVQAGYGKTIQTSGGRIPSVLADRAEQRALQVLVRPPKFYRI